MNICPIIFLDLCGDKSWWKQMRLFWSKELWIRKQLLEGELLAKGA